MKEFEPQIEVICLKCATIIFSTYSGEFVRCECGACFVDETEYYHRLGGNPKEREICITKTTYNWLKE